VGTPQLPAASDRIRAVAKEQVVPGRPVETEFELTSLEPGREIAFKSINGSFPVSGVYSFAPAGESTAVTFDLQGEPGGFFRLAEPLLGRMIQRQWDANVANLKDILESNG